MFGNFRHDLLTRYEIGHENNKYVFNFNISQVINVLLLKFVF